MSYSGCELFVEEGYEGLYERVEFGALSDGLQWESQDDVTLWLCYGSIRTVSIGQDGEGLACGRKDGGCRHAVAVSVGEAVDVHVESTACNRGHVLGCDG